MHSASTGNNDMFDNNIVHTLRIQLCKTPGEETVSNDTSMMQANISLLSSTPYLGLNYHFITVCPIPRDDLPIHNTDDLL